MAQTTPPSTQYSEYVAPACSGPDPNFDDVMNDIRIIENKVNDCEHLVRDLRHKHEDLIRYMYDTTLFLQAGG